MESTKFFTNVQELCSKKGISITALGNKLGLSNSTTFGWRKGSHPRSKTLKALADYFNVSVDDLLNGENIEMQDNQNDNGTVYISTITNNGTKRPLSEQEVALLDVFSQLGVMEQAKLLVYAEGLKENSR